MMFLLSAGLICPSVPNCCNSTVIPKPPPVTLSRLQCNRSGASWLLICSLEASELFTFEDDRWQGMQDGGLGRLPWEQGRHTQRN